MTGDEGAYPIPPETEARFTRVALATEESLRREGYPALSDRDRADLRRALWLFIHGVGGRR